MGVVGWACPYLSCALELFASLLGHESYSHTPATLLESFIKAQINSFVPESAIRAMDWRKLSYRGVARKLL